MAADRKHRLRRGSPRTWLTPAARPTFPTLICGKIGRMGRPSGEIAKALLQAAGASHGTVAELAVRAQVGFSVARYTASRLLSRGQLEVAAKGRPAILGLPREHASAEASKGRDLAAALSSWR